MGLTRFSESDSIVRMTFFTGKGEAIQSGGYQTPNLFGTSLDKPLYGTHNSFGIPLEVVLRVKESNKVVESSDN